MQGKGIGLAGAVLAGALGMLHGEAGARPPPPPDEIAGPARERRPAIEWSSWVRVAYGAAPAAAEPRARVTSPVDEPDARDHGWEAALGADLTFGVGEGGNVRLGPWIEARTSSAAMVGGELMLAARPRRLDMFWYAGEGVLVLRAGGNRELLTGAIAYGYRAPWKLHGPWRGGSRYMIGVRLVATATRAADDPSVWSATLGVETEPVGALRYLLGIRSWY